MSEAVIKSGWLYREELVSGAVSAWKKRWNVLTLHKLCWFKHNQSTEPISKCAIAAIESMSFGDVEEREWVFTLSTSRGAVKLAAETEEDRTDWVNTLRTLVPKAKVALAQEMLMRKAKRKAAHELLYKLMRDAIESILRDSKRVSHLGAYRPYAQALAMILLKLNSCVSGIAKFAGLGPPATAAADAVRGSVDAANSAAAICVNKFTQDNIVVRTRDIGLECARVLEFSKEAKTDMDARENMRKSITLVDVQIKEFVLMLTQSGDLDHALNEAKAQIETYLVGGAPDGDPLPADTLDERIQRVLAKGEEFKIKLDEVAENAPKNHGAIPIYSKDTATLLCEILAATNIISTMSGYDPDDPEFLAKVAAGPQIPEGASEEEREAAIAAFEASIGGISLFKLQQLQSLLAAAKGFAAATVGMIDVMKEIPGPEDERIKLRFDLSTRSTDSALTAFMNATRNLDTMDPKLRHLKPEVDPEDQMTKALNGITAALEALGGPSGDALAADGSLDIAALQASLQAAMERGDTVSMTEAARLIAQHAAGLMKTSAEIQAEIKKTRGTGIYVQDQAWTNGLIEAASALGRATVEIVEAANKNDPESMLSFLREGSLNAATTRLVAFSRAKANPDSEPAKLLDGHNANIQSGIHVLLHATKQRMLELSEQRRKQNQPDQLALISAAQVQEQQRLEFEAQAKIARLETELERAKRYFAKVSKALP